MISTSNMADDEWLQVKVRKDDLRRWLKACSLKTTGRKQELIDGVIKAKEDWFETIEERAKKRKSFEKLELLNDCAVHLRIFQILKL